MKQILQSLKTRATEVADILVLIVKRGQRLIKTTDTLVSAGTERMLVKFGKAGWLDKARKQPNKVSIFLDKINTDGLQSTVEAFFNKLDQRLPLGYCNEGRISAIGAKAFFRAIEGRAPVPIPSDEILEVSLVSIELAGGVQ